MSSDQALTDYVRRWIDVEDPREVPAYSVSEAAQILGMPSATLRSWTLGRPYHLISGERAKFRPLVAPAQTSDPALLSFFNLVELHVLMGMRRHHRLKIPVIRDALDWVENELQVERPLVREEFMTDGAHLFVRYLGEIVSVSERGQTLIRGLLDEHLARIDRDPGGIARRLYPFIRSMGLSDHPSHIMVDPRYAFGRPALRGSGIATRTLYERYMAGESVVELAEDYARQPAEVEDAIRCESRAAA